MRSDPALRRAAISWARERPADAPAPVAGLRASTAASRPCWRPDRRNSRMAGLGRAAARLPRSDDDAAAERWAAAGRALRDAGRDGLRRGIPESAPIRDRRSRRSCSTPSDNLERFELPAVGVVGIARGDPLRPGRGRPARPRSLARRRDGRLGLRAGRGPRRARGGARAWPGGTIAVLGCGLDVDYPREHARAEGGHEGATGCCSRSILRAPSRDRRTSRSATASSRDSAAGVVVVEASRRSGSLITARLAGDFGRDVFAVPGSVFSQTSIGTHELLRDGAILCRGAEDVLAELFPAIGRAAPPGDSGDAGGRSPRAVARRPGASGDAPQGRKTLRPRSSRRRPTCPPRRCWPRSSSSRRRASPSSAKAAGTEPGGIEGSGDLRSGDLRLTRRHP